VTRWLALAAIGALLCTIVAMSASAQEIELPRTVPSYNQAYSDGPGAWGDCALGTGGCPDRIRTTGCLTTAFASVLAYYGVEVSVASADSCTGKRQTGMTPGILNDWLRAHSGYGHCVQDPMGNCCLNWERLPGDVELTFHVNRSEVGLNPVASVVIDHALRQGHPVVAGVHWGARCHTGSQTEDCHWIVLTGKRDATYTIIDPYNANAASPYGIRTTLDAGVHGAYIIDRFVIVERDPSLSTSYVDTPSVSQEPAGERSDASVLALLAILTLVAAVVLLISGSRP